MSYLARLERLGSMLSFGTAAEGAVKGYEAIDLIVSVGNLKELGGKQ